MASKTDKTSKHCCLKKCEKESQVITQDDPRVEVKTFVLDKVASLRKLFLVAWETTGEASFHNQCWHHLLKETLSDTEKDMVKEAKKTAEFHDGVAPTKAKAARIAKMIKDAEYCIVFTGAGISTAAGIGDFRGKSGKWTERDLKKKYGAGVKMDKEQKKRVKCMSLRPTYTHEAIARLVEMGLVKHVISQNCDGLHGLSGIPVEKLWELHGNMFHERCEKCNARYQRNFYVEVNKSAKCPQCRLYHRTGRKCEKKGCDGHLMKTVINFGDHLEDHVLGGAEACATQNDLVLCLGTTLMVSPANSLVEMGKEPPRLVICNRQSTPCDDLCYAKDGQGRSVGVRVFGDCDPLMRDVMDHILGTEERLHWEGQREERMKDYDKDRST